MTLRPGLLEVACLAGVVACSGAPRASAPQRTFTDGVVHAASGSLHVRCLGEGNPTVIFDSGLGNDGTAWQDVHPAVSRMTRACVYDRAGLGTSGPAPRRHTSRRMMTELRAVLQKAEIRGPYVLVGHSLGGLNMRLFASEYGAAGLVLVDAVSEDQDTRYWSLLPPRAFAELRKGLDEIPEGLDFDAFRESMAEVRASRRSFGHVPVVVLTRGKAEPPIPDGTPELDAQMARAWSEMQADLRRLSPEAIQVVAANSGHFIPREAPELVVAAVREVLATVATGVPLDGARLTPHLAAP